MPKASAAQPEEESNINKSNEYIQGYNKAISILSKNNMDEAKKLLEKQKYTLLSITKGL